jgi:hypothetical protein
VTIPLNDPRPLPDVWRARGRGSMNKRKALANGSLSGIGPPARAGRPSSRRKDPPIIAMPIVGSTRSFTLAATCLGRPWPVEPAGVTASGALMPALTCPERKYGASPATCGDPVEDRRQHGRARLCEVLPYLVPLVALAVLAVPAGPGWKVSLATAVGGAAGAHRIRCCVGHGNDSSQLKSAGDAPELTHITSLLSPRPPRGLGSTDRGRSLVGRSDARPRPPSFPGGRSRGLRPGYGRARRPSSRACGPTHESLGSAPGRSPDGE